MLLPAYLLCGLLGAGEVVINEFSYDDSGDDDREFVELYNPSNAVFPDGATTLRATGVILDDDGFGNDRALLVSSLTVTEDAGSTPQAVFEVRLSEPSATPITLAYTTSDASALAGQDYTTTAGNLTFAPGETLQTVAVPLIGDTVPEANEFFNLVFTPTGDIANGVEGAVGTATIIDDDTDSALPEISITAGEVVESPNTTPVLRFYVRLSEPASDTVDINYRTLQGESAALDEGVDYFQNFSFVRIQAGETSESFEIAIQDLDNLDEADESIVVELFNPVNAVFPDGVRTLEATGFILDDDGTGNDVGLFVENAQIVEGANGATREVAVPVLLSRPLDFDLTLNFSTSAGSALADIDFISTSGTVTFLAGETKTAAIIQIKLLGHVGKPQVPAAPLFENITVENRTEDFVHVLLERLAGVPEAGSQRRPRVGGERDQERVHALDLGGLVVDDVGGEFEQHRVVGRARLLEQLLDHRHRALVMGDHQLQEQPVEGRALRGGELGHLLRRRHAGHGVMGVHGVLRRRVGHVLAAPHAVPDQGVEVDPGPQPGPEQGRDLVGPHHGDGAHAHDGVQAVDPLPS